MLRVCMRAADDYNTQALLKEMKGISQAKNKLHVGVNAVTTMSGRVARMLKACVHKNLH